MTLTAAELRSLGAHPGTFPEMLQATFDAGHDACEAQHALVTDDLRGQLKDLQAMLLVWQQSVPR